MEQKEVDKAFKGYRDSGIALSVTLISLSGGLMLWSNNRFHGTQSPISACDRRIFFSQMAFLAFAVIGSICIQVFNYHGYKCRARALVGQDSESCANIWFDKEDLAVHISVLLFSLGLILSAILFVSAV